MNGIRTITKEQAERVRYYAASENPCIEFYDGFVYRVDENNNIVCSEIFTDNFVPVQVI